MPVLDLEVKIYMRQRHPGRSTFERVVESREEEPQTLRTSGSLNRDLWQAGVLRYPAFVYSTGEGGKGK